MQASPTTLKSLLMRHSKGKIDMILEPMQVMVQLALLSFSPRGTKISIHDNIIILQPPTTTQGLIRWYNNDSKDDIYYLFKAVLRYYKLYRNKNDAIFTYILELAKSGLDQLSLTYSNTDKASIIHTLSMYKAVLKSDPSKFFNCDQAEIDDIFKSITEIYDSKRMNIIYNFLKIIKEEDNEDFRKQFILALTTFFKPINFQIKSWIQGKISG